jgi:glucosylceramidase
MLKTINIALITTLGLGVAGLGCSSSAPAPNNGTAGTSAAQGGSAPGAGGSGAANSPGIGGSGNPGAAGSSVGAGGDGVLAGGGTPGAAGTAGTADAAGGTAPAAGTGNTAGGASFVEPELVTSGKDDYWKVGTLTKGGTAATVTVKTTGDGLAQAWDGFGGTFNEKGAQMLMGLDAAKQAEIMKKLFDVKDGIGFTWGRIPIGPSDYAIERYNFQDSATATFSIEHDKTASATSKAPIMPFIKAAIAVKADIKFWGSAWTPPPWMKDNKAYDKGSMDKANFTAYADYLVNWIKAYEAEGIKINFIVPQNEPGWAQAYPSCAWGSYKDGNTAHYGTAYLGDFVKNNLSQKMTDAKLTTDIWYGTFSNDGAFPDYWANVPPKNLLKGVTLQWATIAEVEKVVAAGYKVMQSEHQCGNYPWTGVDNGDGSYKSTAGTTADTADATHFFADYAPNNHLYGEESWTLIKSWIDKGVNSYSAWNLVLDKGGFNLDKVRPWPQNALIVVDGTTVKYTAAYYVFRHVAEFVEPGATVLKTMGGSALAFKNPDGTVVVTLYNSGAAAATQTVSIDGTMYQVNVPSHGWATVNKKG